MKKLKNAVKPTSTQENTAKDDRTEIKVEEPDDISQPDPQPASPAATDPQNALMWYGYRLFPYNYQSPYCGA